MHRPALDRLLRQPGGPVYDKVISAPLDATVALVLATGPRITSHLVNKHFTEIEGGPGRLKGRLVYDADYILFVIKGTGIHGPHNTPIVPKHKRYLRFKNRNGDIVYARSVQGQKPNPFLANAFRAACPWPVTIH